MTLYQREVKNMIDKRNIVLMGLVFVGFLLYNQWTLEHATKAQAKTAQTASSVDGIPPSTVLNDKQSLPPGSVVQQQVAQESTENIPPSRLIHVSTDVLDITIDKKGGNIVSAKLLDYHKKLKGEEPIQILNDSAEKLYVAQSGLLSKLGPDKIDGQATFESSQNDYVLKEGQQDLNIDLNWTQNGLKVTKVFHFTREKYDVGVEYSVDNTSGLDWVGNFYAQIRRKKEEQSSSFGLNTYQGPSISTDSKPYEKINYKKMAKSDLSQTSKGGWIAMQQRYFVSAWIPDQSQTNHFFSRADKDDIFTVGFVGPELKVASGTKTTVGGKFYVGPELEKPLAAVAPHLELVIDYGWLWIISSAIFWVMSKIYSVIGNWGWSIILVTLLIKLMFYKLSATSYRSMAKMRDLAPRLELLKQRYGNDKQKMSKATMELYKTEKVNPLGGCLPMLIQIPVFIALYYVLIESVHLRHAPFMLWIQDLSVKDPLFILPILMGASMFVQQLLNPPAPDPLQAKIMKYALPLFFTVFFMTFPAGLVLYWLVNNCLSILQQWYIMKTYSK